MKGVNRVLLVGTVGNDPDFKTFPNGGQMALISIATNEEWTDKNTGERRKETEWHRVKFSDNKAKIVSQYVRKGMKLYIEGSIKTRKWTDQAGIEREAKDIICHNFQMLDSPNVNGGNQQNRQPATNSNSRSGYAGNQGGNFKDPNDDNLPF